MKYLRICFEGENGPSMGKLYPIDKLPKIDSELAMYRSIFFYEEKHLVDFNKMVQKTSKDGRRYDTINGNTGIKDITSNILVWDFDNPNIEISRDNCLQTLEKLDKDFNVDEAEITFSGNKGFGLQLKIDKWVDYKQMRDICATYGVGHDDTIYKFSQPIRLTGTKHTKSGLFKTKLSLEDLTDLTMIEIKDKAKTQVFGIELLEQQFKCIIKPKEEIKPKKEATIMTDKLDLSQKPKWLSNWRYALTKGFFPGGIRHEVNMILATTWKAQGFDKEATYHAIKGFNELQAKRHNSDKFSKDELWQDIMGSVYSPTWQGGIYTEDNFPQILKDYFKENHIERNSNETNKEHIFTKIDEAFERFREYAKNIDENTLTFGLPSLDKKLHVRLGNLIGVLAPPKVGKTSLLITILNNLSQRKIPSLFFSLDMNETTVIEKLIIRETGNESEKMYDAFRNDELDLQNRYKKILSDNYKYTDISFKSSLTIPELKQAILDKETEFGEKIKFIGVDYSELIRASVSEPTQASMEVIQGLREIANEGRVVMVLLQPKKVSAVPNQPLLDYNDVKGSGAISQAVFAMLTLHRPGYSSVTPEEDNFLGLNVVANRGGPCFALDYHWTGLTGKIRELTDVERVELYQLRKAMNEKIQKDDY